MKLPMSKAEAAKLDQSLDIKHYFGDVLGPIIADWLKKVFRRTFTSKDEAFSVHVIGGEIHIELPAFFGFNQNENEDPECCYLKFWLTDLVKNELEFGWFCTSQGRKGDPLFHVRNLRKQMTECLEMMDKVEKFAEQNRAK